MNKDPKESTEQIVDRVMADKYPFRNAVRGNAAEIKNWRESELAKQDLDHRQARNRRKRASRKLRGVK